MKKTYNKKSKEDKEREVNELLEKANEGTEKCFTSPEQFKELASYMSKFYNYSFRNTFLIQEQFEGALAVGSYAFWKEKGFTVNKGEKGIKILVPNRLSDYFINSKGEEVKLSKATLEEKRLIEQGEIEVRKGKLIFNQGYVFEVSQTNAKAEDLPKIFPNRWLEGEVKNYDLMYKAMENIAKKIGVKIIEPKNELGAVKGVSYPMTKEVALNPRNTQLQNVKTLIHELTHAKLHTMETRDSYTTNAKEFQAEMSAYVVCSYFGLDTSDYSFRYISSWTKDVELKDKEKLISEVRETIKEYIEVIEKTLINDKELSLSLDGENSLEKNENIEYDKNLYEVKEKESMNESEYLFATETTDNKNEIKLKDKQLIKLLGKDIVTIKAISKEELENKINNNKSYIFLQKDKELSIKNEVAAIEHKGRYRDIYVNKIYSLKDIIYIDDNKELYIIEDSKKNLYVKNEEENEYKDISTKENWELSEHEIRDMEFKVIKENIKNLMDRNYENFIKGIISIEMGIEDLDLLDNIYAKYMDNDFNLINDKFEELKNDLEKDSKDMISSDKEKEIRKKIREHEEWINSKGIRGKQLNLENENLSGMVLLNVDLRNANFKNADVTQCVIFADLRGANFEGAKIDNTKWIGSNISKMTIEANKLNLIEYQLEQEGCKHTEARKSLKTNRKDVELER